MRLTAGAYPCYFADPDLNREFLAALGRDERFGSLELPLRGLDDPLAWPDGAPAEWGAVITQIPGTMGQLGTNPDFGLSSTSAAGREAAIAFTRHTFERAQALSGAGHPVIAVELHSAPRGNGDVAALAESLIEIGSWGWGDTQLIIEHCDAPRPGIAPQKGFLELADEIAAVTTAREASPTRIGVAINWARSVIETRSTQAGYAHLIQAREAGVLNGLMFSSCSPEATSFGEAWIDAHLAPVGAPGAPTTSLLTDAIIRACLDAAPSDLHYLGFKVGLDGIESPADRAAAWSRLADLAG